MAEGQCSEVLDVGTAFFDCEREHGHGGAHRREVLRQSTVKPPVRYIVSWWEEPTDAEG